MVNAIFGCLPRVPSRSFTSSVAFRSKWCRGFPPSSNSFTAWTFLKAERNILFFCRIPLKQRGVEKILRNWRKKKPMIYVCMNFAPERLCTAFCLPDRIFLWSVYSSFIYDDEGQTGTSGRREDSSTWAVWPMALVSSSHRAIRHQLVIYFDL